jgi:hypothetical protein
MRRAFPTLVFAVLALPPTAQEPPNRSEPPVFDAAAAEAARAIRDEAALVLERALEHDDQDRDAMLAAARTSADRLGHDSRVGARLRALDAPRTADVSRALERAVADLRFELYEQAPLPDGFPPTAPVDETVLKRYPAYRMARADMGSANMSGPFMKLFRHIQDADIAMTAPVQVDLGDDGRSRGGTMAFLYRHPDQGTAGRADAVEVVDVPAGMALAIGARGNESPQRLAEFVAALEQRLASHRGLLERAGPVRTMGYNDPRVPASRRFFEVEIPVRLAASVEPDRSEPTDG